MSVVITVFNQKGGVGKSTTVINLSSALALRGKRTLIIDMDPQGNSTSGLGVYEFKNMIYDFLIDEKVDSIYKTGFSKLDIIPSNGEFAGVEIELARCEDWQFKLRKMLDKVKDNYDYVIIDSPPSLGILSMMSLVASDKILIPVQCEYYALEGVSQLMDTITLVKDNFNPNLNILGIVMSMYDGRTNLSNQVVEEVEKFFKDKVFKTYIPRNVRLAEAPSFGMNIFDYDSKSKGAKAYIDLAKEVIGEVNGEEK
ncbi:ParA family protein [Peptoniphilus lacydonensis]|uniref:ParA family protein n=1 Tax=Peptoniphilus lacydonensis TaxID=1673725 RepID=UPI0008D95FA2|nr:ParA family protein [Peptoniphilus lacydonensis]